MAGAIWNCCHLGAFCTPHKVHACLAVTCHLHFWQNNRDLLRDTAVTRGWKRYHNKSQHRKLWLFFQHCDRLVRVTEGSTPSYKPHLLPVRLPMVPLCGAVLTGGTEGSTQDFHPQKDCTDCRNAVPKVSGLRFVSYLSVDYFAVSTWEFTDEKNFKMFSIFLWQGKSLYMRILKCPVFSYDGLVILRWCCVIDRVLKASCRPTGQPYLVSLHWTGGRNTGTHCLYRTVVKALRNHPVWQPSLKSLSLLQWTMDLWPLPPPLF